MKHKNIFWTFAVLAAGIVGYIAIFKGYVDKTVKDIGDGFTEPDSDEKDQ